MAFCFWWLCIKKPRGFLRLEFTTHPFQLHVDPPRRPPQVRPGLVFQSIDVHLKKIVGQIQLRGISLTERPYDEGARARRHVDLL